jgi:hypothetical protein
MAAGKHKVKPGTTPVTWRSKMRRTALAVGIIVGAASIAPSAAAFEPPADPEDTFTCPNGEFVPGHPGFPGIATGRYGEACSRARAAESLRKLGTILRLWGSSDLSCDDSSLRDTSACLHVRVTLYRHIGDREAATT